MVSFYVFSKRYFVKSKILSDARVASITKKKYGFCSTFLAKIHKVLKVNIQRMIKCDLLKRSFVWNFHNKIVCKI